MMVYAASNLAHWHRCAGFVDEIGFADKIRKEANSRPGCDIPESGRFAAVSPLCHATQRPRPRRIGFLGTCRVASHAPRLEAFGLGIGQVPG